MALPFFTIGHSTRTIDEFVELLRQVDVTRVIDVRAVPRSRTNPQYNRERMPETLAPFGIDYEHIAALGGLRSKQASPVSDEINGFWRNRSFHNYADYALSEDFHAGFEQLMHFGEQQRCAIMCSEAVWWRCHRRIIADHLICHDQAVFHLMGTDRVQPARLTEAATINTAGQLVYPARSASATAPESET